MEITKEQADKMMADGNAVNRGTVVDNGWRWQVIANLVDQRTDHYRIERA